MEGESSSSGGRGALLRKLIDMQSKSAESENSTTSLGARNQDSGIGFSQNPTISTPRPAGRSRLLEMLSSSSSVEMSQPINILPIVSRGGGRARLLSLLTTDMEEKATITQRTSMSCQQPAPNKNDYQTKDSKDFSGEGVNIKPRTDVQKSISYESKSTDEEQQAVLKRGTKGAEINVACNYIRLKSDGNKAVFEYEVKFSPPVDSRSARIKYLNEHCSKFGGTKTFDGVTLYLPILLADQVTQYYSKNPANNSNIEIIILYKRKKPLRECMHIYNVLFDRIMKILNYVRFDRKQFDPTAPKIIPQHKLEVWPGYVTAVDEYEGGIMICCDTSHRVLCQTTVLDILVDTYRANSNRNEFQENAKKSLLGSVVLTRYNNKTYRIDDIDFTSNPLSTFLAKDKEITYADYYKNQYNITIKDLKQPLLKSIKSRRINNAETTVELQFFLVPEICYLTGLRDEMRANTIVMKDIATFTRITPNQRMLALKKFIKNIKECKEARDVLENWGLTLANGVENLIGRQFENEMIIFLKAQHSAGPNSDFGKYATNNELLDIVNIQNWLLIYNKNDRSAAQSFLDCIDKISSPMGIEIRKPNVHLLHNDRTDTYVSTLREKITKDIQIVVIICPTSRDDRYAAIKKLCCTEIPVPSQVINARTLKDPTKNRSIVQKIVLQMNCKLGGSLWTIRIPFKNVMICGIDSYHHPAGQGNSVSAFVASLNENYTKWYSRAVIQTKKEEIVNGLCVSLKYALMAYERRNGYLPEKIIIYRDGVGDGSLKVVKEYELPQFQQACKLEKSNYNPLLTYIIVQKRINTRFFMQAGNDFKNPNPGFVMDHTVTRKYLYDFFLVSQSVRQGTVTPSHYIVLHDSAQMNPDIVQRLSYKLCFLYYNWPGTVRVPACCQYAHKLCYLVGDSIKRPTSEVLSTKLFYL